MGEKSFTVKSSIPKRQGHLPLAKPTLAVTVAAPVEHFAGGVKILIYTVFLNLVFTQEQTFLHHCSLTASPVTSVPVAVTSPEPLICVLIPVFSHDSVVGLVTCAGLFRPNFLLFSISGCLLCLCLLFFAVSKVFVHLKMIQSAIKVLAFWFSAAWFSVKSKYVGVLYLYVSQVKTPTCRFL